jgi:hypothetical protein
MEGVNDQTDAIATICSHCKNLDPAALSYQPDEEKREHPSVELDWKSLFNNIFHCSGCALLVDIICCFCTDFRYKKENLNTLDQHFLKQKYLTDADFNLDGLSMSYHHSIRLHVKRKELVLYCIRPTPWSGIAVQNHLSGWTGSQDTLKFAKDVIARCSQEHDACQMPQNTPLPTRVLDLGDTYDLEEKEKIRLVETGHRPASYAALSHCWGNAHRILTTKETIRSHMEGIEFKSLPLTFRDAVHFTRQLCIRYLWIDSL